MYNGPPFSCPAQGTPWEGPGQRAWAPSSSLCLFRVGTPRRPPRLTGEAEERKVKSREGAAALLQNALWSGTELRDLPQLPATLWSCPKETPKGQREATPRPPVCQGNHWKSDDPKGAGPHGHTRHVRWSIGRTDGPWAFLPGSNVDCYLHPGARNPDCRGAGDEFPPRHRSRLLGYPRQPWPALIPQGGHQGRARQAGAGHSSQPLSCHWGDVFLTCLLDDVRKSNSPMRAR